MPMLNAKTRKRSRTSSRKTSLQRNDFADKKLAELLTSYRRVGELLEALIGRERLYQPDFMKGLDEALQEVSLKKTHEVRSFADFIS